MMNHWFVAVTADISKPKMRTTSDRINLLEIVAYICLDVTIYFKAFFQFMILGGCSDNYKQEEIQAKHLSNFYV